MKKKVTGLNGKKIKYIDTILMYAQRVMGKKPFYSDYTLGIWSKIQLCKKHVKTTDDELNKIDRFIEKIQLLNMDQLERLKSHW